MKKIIFYCSLLLVLIFFSHNYYPHNLQAEDIDLRTVFADIAEETSPAVVQVNSITEEDASAIEFYDYSRETEEEIKITGTGFIIDASGYILTNSHLVSQSSEINIKLDGQLFPAEKIGSDFNLDLALLKIDATNQLPTVDIAVSDNLRPGDWVLAIGNAYGDQRIISSGIVSALNRSISLSNNGNTRNYNNLIQTDAAINPGNSGGPLLNIYGEVIGINTAVDTQKQNVSYAVPSSSFIDVITELKEYGKVLRPWTGLHVQEISEDVAEFMGLNSSERVLISSIDTESPAEAVGIKAGDILIEFNEQEIKNSSDFRQGVNNTEIGQTISLVIIRDDEEKEFDLEITEMP